ncbi:MAG: class I SAM-dependent methyltransferase [Clostridia bacterium]|nr:class I SAM-dependent methyltransferase [Clostridia bacterium]
MWLTDKWKDFEVIDAGGGEKLERWGDIILARPDPQVIWKEKSQPSLWKRADAHYIRSNEGGGHWEYKRTLPDSWKVNYENLTFNIKTMGFKHTGLFPEQGTNWDFIISKIKGANRPVKVLNLFAYTGGATVAAAYAGAEEVVHVDAAKGIVAQAKENIISSGLEDKFVRFIVDDVQKFVAREQRRGRKYDAIIMDPPSYGRGPNGEVWKFEDELFKLIESCMEILSDNPLFFMINSYTTGISPIVVSNILSLTLKKRFGGEAHSEEIGLPISSSGLILPCGATSRWYK